MLHCEAAPPSPRGSGAGVEVKVDPGQSEAGATAQAWAAYLRGMVVGVPPSGSGRWSGRASWSGGPPFLAGTTYRLERRLLPCAYRECDLSPAAHGDAEKPSHLESLRVQVRVQAMPVKARKRSAVRA
ncbi:hypothetical protein GCM10010222_74490 [Streptomyces tanashiensis]|nr:hypothetical protein GCM10010222_74490 [Streptomyces tanashiensis]